jgi:hypothetical protein
MSNTRMILLEFNELCPYLIHRFISAGQLPAFQRLHDESLVYTTRAQERAPYLDPWIQWLTVHTGLNHAQHHVDRLNEGHACDAKRIWDVVSEHGGTAWICGSMSTSYRGGFRGALVPDPWTTKVQPTPARLRPYFSFVQSSVLDSTNARASMSPREAARFAGFMATHGLSVRTVAAIGRQMIVERWGGHRWKRAVLLDQLQFDLFRHHWKRERPMFSTLFLNSTAHFQHLHWREMEPHLFRVQPTEEEIAEYRSAILFGYQQMDVLLGRVLKMIDGDTTVVLASALSQQPCLAFEHQGGKSFYRPRSFEQLFTFAGVSGYTTVMPVMAHQFHVEFQSADAARAGAARLQALHVGDRPALAAECNGNQLFAWCPITTDLDSAACLTSDAEGVPRTDRFLSIFFKVEGIKSGMHHPDGLFWIRRPTAEHQRFDEPVALDLVAPTLLSALGIAPPTPMRQDPLLLSAESTLERRSRGSRPNRLLGRTA